MGVAFTAYAKNNGAYKASKPMPKGKPEGIVLHSTGCNNPNLRRYVNAPEICGENPYKNYFDRPDSNVCPHAVVGKDKNGVVQAAKILPYSICCWGCGSGWRGSYNYNPAYVQIEICEDGLTDKQYFEEAFAKAAELCRAICGKYGIPHSNIVSHKEAHKLGYASNHGDPENWLGEFGRDMDWFRRFVSGEKTYFVTGSKTVTESELTQAKSQLRALGYNVIVTDDK